MSIKHNRSKRKLRNQKTDSAGYAAALPKDAVINEAARILIEEGVTDYQHAKRKAAQRLGYRPDSELPRNQDIEAAVKLRQRLFSGDGHQQQLQLRREAALAAMEFFQAFQPRLAGDVLSGSNTDHSAVELHLFADTVEELQRFLLNQDIPYQQRQIDVRTGRERFSRLQSFDIDADGIPFALIVFDGKNRLHRPWCSVNQKSLPRFNSSQLKALLLNADVNH